MATIDEGNRLVVCDVGSRARDPQRSTHEARGSIPPFRAMATEPELHIKPSLLETVMRQVEGEESQP